MGWKDTIKVQDAEKVSTWRDTIERPKTWGETAVSTVANTLPAAGGLVGGVVGAGAGPAGAMLGAGGGYAAGDLVREKILQAVGERIPNSGAGDIIKNVGMGAAFEGGGQLAVNAAKSLYGGVKALPSGTVSGKALDLAERIPGITGKVVKYGRRFVNKAVEESAPAVQKHAVDDFIKGTSPPPPKTKWDFPIKKK